MFFVGIGGCFLPYLILLGLVFTFSIQAPARTSGYAMNAGQNEDSACRIDASLSASASCLQANYIYSSYCSHECSTEKYDYKEKKSQSVFMLVLLPVQAITREQWFLRDDFLNDRFSLLNFSGLSPPSLCCFV
ncbi:MAG: hypothetical protein PWQ17_1063 [Anaerophaga sp.]|uniref:hypothetical protein n=1 Tax=Anaerophaga thermohalophila TaxID=177400 RepID=UPI000237D38C|nr:hypothetical protein [Anaerophaga thermohalophila]MDK2841558.1 hypothetical protein [Anaerophaga sp.]